MKKAKETREVRVLELKDALALLDCVKFDKKAIDKEEERIIRVVMLQINKRVENVKRRFLK